MNKTDQGFSAVEGLLVLAIVVVIGAVGFGVLHHKRTVASANTSSKTTAPAATLPQPGNVNQPDAPIGTTQSIDSLTTEDASSETGIDSKHSSSDQSSAATTDGDAANVGGAYNEATL